MIQQHPRVCQAHFFKKTAFFPESALRFLFPGKTALPLSKKSPPGQKARAPPLRGRALVGLSSAQDPLLEDPAVPVLALPSAEELLSSAVLASITAWISFLAPRVRDWAFSQKAWGSIWS